MKSDGSLAKPWKLCTVQQVENLEGLIKIIPLWSTGIFLSTPLANSRQLDSPPSSNRGPSHWTPLPNPCRVYDCLRIHLHFCLTYPHGQIPIPHVAKANWPTPQLLSNELQLALNVLSMAVSAMVESKRLKAAESHHLQGQNDSVVPISIIWLVPPLAIVGVAEAFHFPGQVALYYQEFPAALKSTATAMVAMFIGIAYYLSTAIVDAARRMTNWLPDNINHGRIDSVYWVIVVIGVLHFSYFLVCAYF